jgi:hypothetical protein
MPHGLPGGQGLVYGLDEIARYQAKLNTGGFVGAGEEFDPLTEINKALVESGADAIRQALARQISVLEGIFHRLTLQALDASRPEHRAILMRTGIQAQQAGLRTLVALGTLGNGKAV